LSGMKRMLALKTLVPNPNPNPTGQWELINPKLQAHFFFFSQTFSTNYFFEHKKATWKYNSS